MTGETTKQLIGNGRDEKIDILRAYAVSVVILFHAFPAVAAPGYLGVDIFFVVSGFVITLSTLRDDRTFDFQYFLSRRIKRLLPAFLAFAALTALAVHLIYFQSELKDYKDAILSLSAFYSNIHFWQNTNYFGNVQRNILLHTWSLSVEIQFYFAFALCFWSLRRFGKVIPIKVLYCLAFLSFILSLSTTSKFSAANFYLLPTRFWEFGLGCYAAAISARKLNAMSSVISVVVGCVLLLSVWFSSVFQLSGLIPRLIVCVGTFFVLISGWTYSSSRFSIFSLLRWVGTSSYSLYLLHVPMLVVARLVIGPEYGPFHASAIILLTFGLVAGIFKPIEDFGRAARFCRYMIIGHLALILAIYSTPSLNIGPFGKFKSLESQTTFPHADYKECFDAPKGMDGREVFCVYGDGPRRIAVLGDSHSLAAYEAAKMALPRDMYTIFYAGRSGCPALLGVDTDHPSNSSGRCYDFNRSIFEQLSNLQISTVISASMWTLYSQPSPSGDLPVQLGGKGLDRCKKEPIVCSEIGFRYGLEQTRQAYQAEGLSLVFMEQVPQHRFAPLDVYRSYYLRGISSVESFTPEEEHHYRNARLNLILREAADSFIETSSVFCSQGRCDFGDRSGLYYIDDNHLSVGGATLLSQKILEVSHSF